MAWQGTIRVFVSSTFILIFFITAELAHATEGYFRDGRGARNQGRAGTGVAYSQDALAPALNPAGLVLAGERLDISLSFFSPRRNYTIAGAPSGAPGSFGLFPGEVDSDSEYFVIPDVGWSTQLNKRSAFGIALYGNGGLNTDYPGSVGQCPPGAPKPSGTFCGGGAGVDLQQLFLVPTYARRFNDNFSWGISAVLAYQRFEATGLAAFAAFSSQPDKLSDNGHDNSFGAGVKFGLEGEVARGLRLGGAYQSRITMQEFDDYAGLFAEDGGLDIPPELSLGLGWRIDGSKTVLFDYKYIWYSQIDSIGNSFDRLFVGALLGSDNGPGFGWDDINVFKVGFEWQASAELTWRAGYSHNDQPVPSSEVLFNILAPGVIRNHVTAGFSWRFKEGNELNVSLMHALEESVSGQNPLDRGQQVELEMQQFELGISWSKRW